jgi:[ribosomal protein S5]-alanine N-acetyltransferase
MLAKDFFRDLPTMRTARLILRKVTLEDAGDMFAYASNPQMTRFTTWDAHKSIDDSRAFLTQAIGKYERGEAMDWAIVDASNNQMIGTCGITNFSEQHQRGDLGYGIAVPYWGKGYMTEAARAAIDTAFRMLPINRLQACCNLHNVGSARVMEKLGMAYEGTFRQFFQRNGTPYDVKWYSLLRAEWDAQTAAARIM